MAQSAEEENLLLQVTAGADNELTSLQQATLAIDEKEKLQPASAKVHGRFVSGLLLVAAIVAIVGSMPHHSTEAQLSNTGGVVSLSSVKSFPSVCDSLIVAETCAKLNRQTGSYHGSAMDQDTSIVHASELSEYLLVSLPSIVKFMESLKILNQEADDDALYNGAFAAKCSDLCQAAVSSVPTRLRPPSSDVGCTRASTCEVDLSPAAIAQIKFPAHKIDDMKIGGKSKEVEADISELDAYSDMDAKQIAVAVARLFRVYLPTNVLTKLKGKSTKEQETMKSVALKAQAIVSIAMDGMAAKKYPALLKTWFGSDGDGTRKRVHLQLMRALELVLSNVEFRSPGPACDATTFAYVDSQDQPPCQDSNSCAKDEKIKKPWPYIVQFCNLYFDSEEGEQIKTVIHEALHHLPMDVDDVKGGYGIEESKALAKSSSKKALNNADNFAFFATELTIAISNAGEHIPTASIPGIVSSQGD